MTFEEQLLGPVIDYLIANKAVGRKELADLYMAVLAPRFVTRPVESVLYRAPNKSYTQNKGLDDAKKGYITKADAAQEVLKKLERVKARVKKLEATCQS
jgi:tRNA A-37 threonylcarbamoyl transferase component Bud32